MTRREHGSATIEAIFAIVFIIVLVLGALQVAFVLYGRNVVAASAHEAARSLIEVPAHTGDAHSIARQTVTRAAGGLVDGLKVTAELSHVGEVAIARVNVSGFLRPLGLLPLSIPVSWTATTSRVALP